MCLVPGGSKSAADSGGRWNRWAQRVSQRFGMSSPAEWIVAAALLALLVVFKIINTARYKFDTDESQHLHVIWGWARGFIQYRDLCDNHMPLFQILFAPIYGLIGDRATILYEMRFILLPMYGVIMWCTYRIGALLFSKRAGLWAVIMAGFYPGYHFCSLEFRTDNLWAPLWLLSVLVLVEEGLTMRAAWTAGLLMGLCFGVSMKTSLLLLSVMISGTVTVLLIGPSKLGIRPKRLGLVALVYLANALLIPGVIMLAFVWKGIWPAFRYWVFENNIVPGLRNHPAWWIFIFPITFPVVIYAARLIIIKRAPDPVVAFRRGFVFLIWGFYVPGLWSFWAQVSRQDYLPYQPLAFVLYAGALLAISDHLAGQETSLGKILRRVPAPAFVAGVQFLVALFAHPFWVDGGKHETDLLRATSKLTDPGDFVLDQKGETIFRQRCFSPIWEPMVVERIRRGLMIDNAAQRCVDTRTCVATKGKDMSATATRFVERNYLPVGAGLYAVGSFLPSARRDDGSVDFDVVIPAAYKVIATDSSMVCGRLDGTPYEGEARLLSPGRHVFILTSKSSSLAVLWAQAVDRGFKPK